MAISEQERLLEEQRLQAIVTDLNQRMQTIEGQLLGQKEEVKRLRTNFWSDISVNADNWDDLLESYVDISQKSLTIADHERNYEHTKRIYERLRKMSGSPYFGRVDFIESGEHNAEQIYLGIGSLLDEKTQQLLIYDWRAPISSIYYDHPLGAAHYETPMGPLYGEITEKRQYVIRNGKLHYLFDTGEHIGDEVLQQALGQHADTQMRSIVATIQKEQNQIIRESNKKMVVVQGVAGSGKTSVAMQRIAFLLYQYRNRITNENMLLLSPNPLFKQYIANVLPELGESNIEQSTLHEYIEAQLGNRYQLEHPYAYLEKRLLEQDNDKQEIYEQTIRFKGSVAFYHIIERYIKHLEQDGFCFRSLRFRGRILISVKEMKEQFYSYDSMKLSNRWERFVEWLLKRLSSIEKEESKQDWVLEEIELLDTEQYQNAFKNVHKRNKHAEATFDDDYLQEQELRKMVVGRHFSRLRKWVKQLNFINLMAMYRQLFHEQGLLSQLAEGSTLPQEIDSICRESTLRLEGETIPYEDSTALLLFRELIYGFRSYLHILYLLVDEAQDYSPFQFKLLTRLFPRAKWTILGDPNQAIWSTGIDLSDDIPQLANLDPVNVLVYHLQRSYRSTKEIVHFTRAILPHAEGIVAFERSGERPQVVVVPNHEELWQRLIRQIEHLQNANMQTIAIICKTEKEAREAYHALHPIEDMQLITKDVKEYASGILIIPSYLAKGLEFDAVLIYNASDEQYGSEGDRYLLYTAATRAMHHLSVYAIQCPSPFLPISNLPS